MEDEEEILDGEQEEEWGLKNIGDYDLEDDFIDDSDVQRFYDNITKKTKYCGFYVHKVVTLFSRFTAMCRIGSFEDVRTNDRRKARQAAVEKNARRQSIQERTKPFAKWKREFQNLGRNLF